MSHSLFVLFDFKRMHDMHKHTHAQTTVTDLMRWPYKVVRQKQQHSVHEPTHFFITVPPTDYSYIPHTMCS